MPMEVELKLNKEDSLQIEKEKIKMVSIPYQNVVDSLMHAMVSTKAPHCICCQFSCSILLNPGEKDWLVAKRIIRYLKGTMGKRLVYRTIKPLILQGFFNVDWVGDVDIRRSTTIYSFFLANEVVRWTNKKQKVVALLRTKSEYMALF
jgi:hypothetical protein